MVSFTLNPEDLESSLWPVKVLLTVTGLFPGGPLLRKLYNAAVSLVLMATGTMHIILNFYHGMDLIVLCHFMFVSVSYCSIMAHIYNMLLGRTNFVEFFVSTMAEVDRNVLDRPKREYWRSTVMQLVMISCVAGFFGVAGFFCFDRVWLILPSNFLFFYASLSLTMIFSVIFNIYVITVVSVLGERFRAINAKLEEPSERNPVSHLDSRPPNSRPRGNFVRSHVSGARLWRQRVVRLMKLHSRLSDVVEFMNSIFGFPILLDVVSSFVVIVTYLYYSVPSNVMPYRGYSVEDAVVTAALLSFANFSKVALLVYHCESASSEANRAAKIIYKIKLFSADDVDVEFAQCVGNLKIDAEVSQVKFSGCGFFSLDFHFLGSLVTAITTYLVILLQYGH
ncbi:gustatory receptor 68a-like [Bacillus rossius redtenbacheri]|uniref:gustatory receptor 68a-like n=1 Tax=Bacillus rossius redtenbacheri TaxID=93214 RepID=UPI002FDD4E93